MLTQLELLGGGGGSLGVDEDSGSGSALDGLAEYPMEQEFEYFDAASMGGGSYYEAQQYQDLNAHPDLLSGIPAAADRSAALIYDNISFPGEELKFGAEDTKPYDAQTDALKMAMEGLQTSEEVFGFPAEDMKPYGDALQQAPGEEATQPYVEGLQSSSPEDVVKFEEDIQGYDFAEDLYDGGLGGQGTDEDFGFGTLYEALDSEHHLSSPEETSSNVWHKATMKNNKGKIGPLQRRALDSIFRVTEKPSRPLVLHIASELGLHHLTVKNFFSNGRRRLRRAAARINDPERTRRENERRKEKRRLAALASAQGADGRGGGCIKTFPRTHPESPPTKEPPVVSPERKALMEKLADKVQRSVAQRSLAAEFDNVTQQQQQQQQQHAHTSQQQQQPLVTQELQHTHVLPTVTPGDILPIVARDLLQPPHDLLEHPTHDLLVQSPNEFLDPTSASPSLLQPPTTTPWDLL